MKVIFSPACFDFKITKSKKNLFWGRLFRTIVAWRSKNWNKFENNPNRSKQNDTKDNNNTNKWNKNICDVYPFIDSLNSVANLREHSIDGNEKGCFVLLFTEWFFQWNGS